MTALMTKTLRASITIMLLLVWLAGFNSSAVHGSERMSVAVLPFFVHSQEPMDYLSQAVADMLATRLENNGELKAVTKAALRNALKEHGWQQINENSARAIGTSVGADFVIAGSLTKIGPLTSLDILVIDTSAAKNTKRIYETLQEDEPLPAKLQDLARRLNFLVLEKVLVSNVLVTGNRFIEKDAILFTIQTKTGSVFSPGILQEDLKRIYEMGYFQDIQITSADTAAGKEITFHVKEKPMVRSIQIVGNKKIKIDDIKEVMEVKPRTILDLNKVNGDAARIKKIYLDKGYYNVKITHKVTPIDNNYTAVRFTIRENDAVKVKKVTFSGNHSIKSKELAKVMETRTKHWLLSIFTTRGIFKDEGLKKDTDRIVAYYYSKGFLQAAIEQPRVEFKKNGVHIHISVNEGDQFTIGSVAFKGDLIYDTAMLESKLKSAAGEIFNGRTMNDDLVALKELYSIKGFAYADVSPLTDLDPEQKKVGIIFDILKGEKIYIEEIKITGNSRTRDNVIRREMRITEGQVYNSQAIKRSKQEINNLGFFEEVNINTEPGSDATLVKLSVELKERPTGSFSIGAGYSSVDSVVGMFQVSQNNLFGKGQNLSFMAQLGGRSNYYNISFTEPWFRDTRVSAGFDIFNMEREYEEFDRDSSGFNLRTSFPLDKYWDYTRFYVTYRYEAIDIEVVDDDVSLDIKNQQGSNTTSSLTGSIVYDSRDDRWKPRDGAHSSFSAEFAGLGGDSKFFALIASSAKYFPMPWDTAFMIRGTIGQIFEYGGEDVPISEKFFMGGLDSLRGFEARSVGPKERRMHRTQYLNFLGKTYTWRPPGYRDKWDTVGGEKELYFNFEYFFPILKEAGVRGSIFFDMGNAYEDSEGFFSDLRYDTGMGLQWYSPFGPLRLSWGYNLDEQYDEDTSNFEFSMGKMF